MGTWGTSLYANDTASDIRGDYVDKLRRGKTNEESTKELIDANRSIMGDEEEEPLFWFALADTQWNYGRLLPSVKEKALEWLEKVGDTIAWKESAKNNDYEAWLRTREKLKEKLLSPQPVSKKVYKYRIYHCKWRVGDVYAYRFESEYSKKRGFYGKHLIFRKIGETRTWPPTITIPVVQIYKWTGEQIPVLNEILKCDQYLCIDYYWNYLWEKNKEGYRECEDDYYTFFSIETTSDRVIPKKQLTYIGNIYGEEEREAVNILRAFPLSWERSKSNFKIEEVFIDIYLSWTLPELHFEESSLYRRLKLRE